MTIEIRELVIRTEVQSRQDKNSESLSQLQLNQIKQQVTAECLRSVKNSQTKNSFER